MKCVAAPRRLLEIPVPCGPRPDSRNELRLPLPTARFRQQPRDLGPVVTHENDAGVSIVVGRAPNLGDTVGHPDGAAAAAALGYAEKLDRLVANFLEGIGDVGVPAEKEGLLHLDHVLPSWRDRTLRPYGQRVPGSASREVHRAPVSRIWLEQLMRDGKLMILVGDEHSAGFEIPAECRGI